MFPVGDDNTARRTVPVVTYALIALNVLFFFVELAGGDAFIETWSFVPTRFLANPAGDFVTVFTSMFMHAGWLHIGGNMLYLWIFGDNVEDRFGHARYLVFYLLCGIAATFAQLVFSLGSSIPNLGASGAIAGVLGAYILLFPQRNVRVMVGYWYNPDACHYCYRPVVRAAVVQRHWLYCCDNGHRGYCLHGAYRWIYRRCCPGLYITGEPGGIRVPVAVVAPCTTGWIKCRSCGYYPGNNPAWLM